jgi:tellurium resistance protein TerD
LKIVTELDEDFSIETAVEFGRLYKRNSEWKFEAVGIGMKIGLQVI